MQLQAVLGKFIFSTEGQEGGAQHHGVTRPWLHRLVSIWAWWSLPLQGHSPDFTLSCTNTNYMVQSSGLMPLSQAKCWGWTPTSLQLWCSDMGAEFCSLSLTQAHLPHSSNTGQYPESALQSVHVGVARSFPLSFLSPGASPTEPLGKVS